MSLRLKRSISKSGRGLVIRIPKDVERALDLSPDSEVWIWVEGQKMIVEKTED